MSEIKISCSTGALTIIFITLKLCGVINWPWVWVIAPLWIPVMLFALILGFAWVRHWCRGG